MFAPQERDQLRKMYFDAWSKRDNKAGLTDLERLIVEVCALHPEYHGFLDSEEAVLHSEFTPEQGQSNPFLHMGMHIAIREQLGSNRPTGLRDAYQQLAGKLQDTHAAEHQIMECLGQIMWEAQRNAQPPDEVRYIDCIKRLI